MSSTASADTVLASLGMFAKHRLALQNAEFAATVGDLEIMATLGKYYAAKIRGATELALYRNTRSVAHQKQSVEHLRLAATYWSRYTHASRRRATAIRCGPIASASWTGRSSSAEVARDRRNRAAHLALKHAAPAGVFVR